MKGNTMSITNQLLPPFVIGLACAGIIFAALTGRSLPLISDPRAALIALLVLGMTLCALGGIGQVGASGRWTSPLAILGILLGIALLVVFVAAFAGWKLPFVQNDNQAVATVAVLMAVKYVIGTAGLLFHWL
jgi:hypothetical protein